MSQMVTDCHLKWRLIHLIFIAYVVILQFTKVIGDNSTMSNCPEEGIIETSEIDCELKKEILTVHNELRQKVAQGLISNQPSASNMQELYWDDELARKAQQWSHSCTFAHSDLKDRTDGRFRKVGENLGQTKSKVKSEKKDFNKHIQKWFNENEQFNYGPILVENLSKYGHYTQLVAANTYIVGCGFSRFRIKNVYYRLYVCHYGPSGNSFNEPPYEAGDVNCKGDLEPSKTYPYLCTRKDPPPQLICVTPTTAINNEAESPTISENPVEGRKSLNALSNDTNNIDSECEQSKPIEDKLHDDKVVNHIRIEKMYNLILLNV